MNGKERVEERGSVNGERGLESVSECLERAAIEERGG